MATIEEVIAEEWRSRAVDLADWAMLRLVNRRDVWGQYSVLTPSERRNSDRSYKAMTLPAVSQRDDKLERVTLDKLTRHFASRFERKPQLIGLHAKSQSTTSRWLGIDIDNHADDASSVDDLARRNLNAAVGWYRKLQQQGHDPLLFDSNGAGGFHLWVLFDVPEPTPDVYKFALSITSDWEAQQLERQPETFPKRVKDTSLGSWFRLPGLHHTKQHHSRVWSGDEGLDDPWLTGHSAIDAMLACVPGSLPKFVNESGAGRKNNVSGVSGKKKAVDAVPGETVRSTTRSRHSRKAKATVCLDLDGVLALRTDGNSIGSPVPGSVEFSRELQSRARVLIYTARFSTVHGKPRSASAVTALHSRIERWLDRHGFAWDEISTGVAKPIASAYVDDRAVSCRPVEDGVAAFDTALTVVDKLTNNH
ncbi:MAG: hypothetical protein AB8B79_12440 [Granulosicoccus sp.]